MGIEDILQGFAPVIILIVLAVLGIAQKIKEQRQVAERRAQDPKTTIQGMPPETRRMIYGDQAPTARPRENNDQSEVADWTELLFPKQPPRPLEPRTAKPRQSATPVATHPKVQSPVPPPLTTARPAPEGEALRPLAPARPPVPPRPARPAPLQRPVRPTVPVQSGRQATPAMQHSRPLPRPHQRETVRTARVPVVEEQEGPKQPRMPAPPPKAPQVRKKRPALTLFYAIEDVRRGIVLSEVLGPPKAFQ
jgi:hypothetical protein